VAILKKNRISDYLQSHLFVLCSNQHLQNLKCAAKQEAFSRQLPLYTCRAAEHTVMTVNSLDIFTVPGLLTRLYVCLFALIVRLANRFCMGSYYV
jgi:hypothetical protein